MTHAQLALVVLLATGAEPADTDAPVRLLVRGASVALTEVERSDIARRVEALIVGCAINSAASPDVLSAEPQQWQDALAGPHLYVRFPEALRIKRGEVRVSEVVVGLTHPSFIGPELSMHGGRLVRHAKCDGHRALALMCAPAVRPHLLPGQAANCKVFDRIGEPREER